MKTRADDSDEFWSMPPGESIYTHAPEPRYTSTGSASTLYGPSKKAKKARKIGFRPPGKK